MTCAVMHSGFILVTISEVQLAELAAGVCCCTAGRDFLSSADCCLFSARRIWEEKVLADENVFRCAQVTLQLSWGSVEPIFTQQHPSSLLRVGSNCKGVQKQPLLHLNQLLIKLRIKLSFHLQSHIGVICGNLSTPPDGGHSRAKNLGELWKDV